MYVLLILIVLLLGVIAWNIKTGFQILEEHFKELNKK